MTTLELSRPRRGAPRKEDTSARERIMAVAEDLFYREGIRATGVDRIVEVSGVSKTSLYRIFQSKDDLITAYAENHARKAVQKWNKAAAEHGGHPRELLDAFIDDIIASIRRPSYRGCPFINLAIEIPDEAHPARRIAVENKAELRQRLEAIAVSLGCAKPGWVADQISMLINGAFATGSIEHGSVDGDSLKAAVATVLKAGGGSWPASAAGSRGGKTTEL